MKDLPRFYRLSANEFAPTAAQAAALKADGKRVSENAKDKRDSARKPAAARHAAGFTLIEVMVVLVIMGVMATGISLGIDSLRGRDADQALKRLRLVLEASADRASVRGRPIAIELLPDGYRFAALDADDNWRPLIDPPVFAERTLPAGLAWAGLRLDGQAEASAAPRLQFGTQAPEYELRVATPGGNARFTGKANGEVILSLPGTSTP